MALKKDIELDNGIVVTYHRIVSIVKVTNSSCAIEVASYINEAQREKEKEALKDGSSMNIFIDTTYISKEYDEEEVISDIYNYLKETEKFKDAEDL
jgi:hypothetical protein